MLHKKSLRALFRAPLQLWLMTLKNVNLIWALNFRVLVSLKDDVMN